MPRYPKRFMLALTEKQHDQLREMAEREGLSMAAFVRRRIARVEMSFGKVQELAPSVVESVSPEWRRCDDA